MHRPLGPPGYDACDDISNAIRFANAHGRDFLFCGPIGWLTWNGTRWAPDTAGVAMHKAKRVARGILVEASKEKDDEQRRRLAQWAVQSGQLQRLRAMVELASTDPVFAVGPDVFDAADRYYFNTQAGTIDLRTGQLLEHDPYHFITQASPVLYDPAATCPTFDRFLAETTCDRPELAAYLQRSLGICLTGHVTEQTFQHFE